MLHDIRVQGYVNSICYITFGYKDMLIVKFWVKSSNKICITLRFVYLLQKQQIGHCPEAIHNQNLVGLQNQNLTNLSHRQ